MVTFSRVGGIPERAYYSIIDMRDGADGSGKDGRYPYYEWAPLEHKELLRAEYGWEGGQYPDEKSDGGGAPDHADQIRDPGIFRDTIDADDDGELDLYIVYSGQGELSGIGLAKLVWQD